MEKMNEIFKVSLSAVLGFFASIYDKYSIMLAFMSIAIVFDVITGIMKTKSKGENLSSKIGTKGFFKKMIFIVAYFFGIFLDLFVPYAINATGTELNINCCFGLIIGAYITLNESISICENLYEINEEIFPRWISNFIKEFKQKIDKDKK